MQVTRNGGFEAVESTDGKVLYYIKLGKGLWSTPVAGGEETSVLPAADAGAWEPADSGIYYFDQALRPSDSGAPLMLLGQALPRPPDSETPLMLFRLADGKPIEIVRPPKLLTVSNSQKVSVTRDGRWIAWVQLDHEDADLILIDNFR